MDEVLAVGDSNFQSKCLEEFNKYRDMGRTVVIVTHDIGVVERYCDRAMLLRNGKIVKIGKADEVTTKYIKENMSDEERRMIKENEERRKLEEKNKKEIEKSEKEKSEKERREREEKDKNKVAEITRVEFLDKDGKEKNVFAAGDDICARVHFEIYKDKKVLNFGMGFFSLEGSYILGINTVVDNIDVDKYLKNKYFTVILKNNLLNKGSYYIVAGVGSDNFIKPYAFLPKSQYFKVMDTKSKNEGIVRLDYEWK
jgi:ABC-type uncharacterized transport system ATPase subunit